MEWATVTTKRNPRSSRYDARRIDLSLAVLRPRRASAAVKSDAPLNAAPSNNLDLLSRCGTEVKDDRTWQAHCSRFILLQAGFESLMRFDRMAHSARYCWLSRNMSVFSVVPYTINNEYTEKCEIIVCNEHSVCCQNMGCIDGVANILKDFMIVRSIITKKIILPHQTPTYWIFLLTFTPLFNGHLPGLSGWTDGHQKSPKYKCKNV